MLLLAFSTACRWDAPESGVCLPCMQTTLPSLTSLRLFSYPWQAVGFSGEDGDSEEAGQALAPLNAWLAAGFLAASRTEGGESPTGSSGIQTLPPLLLLAASDLDARSLIPTLSFLFDPNADPLLPATRLLEFLRTSQRTSASNNNSAAISPLRARVYGQLAVVAFRRLLSSVAISSSSELMEAATGVLRDARFLMRSLQTPEAASALTSLLRLAGDVSQLEANAMQVLLCDGPKASASESDSVGDGILSGERAAWAQVDLFEERRDAVKAALEKTQGDAGCLWLSELERLHLCICLHKLAALRRKLEALSSAEALRLFASDSVLNSASLGGKENSWKLLKAPDGDAAASPAKSHDKTENSSKSGKASASPVGVSLKRQCLSLAVSALRLSAASLVAALSVGAFRQASAVVASLGSALAIAGVSPEDLLHCDAHAASAAAENGAPSAEGQGPTSQGLKASSRDTPARGAAAPSPLGGGGLGSPAALLPAAGADAASAGKATSAAKEGSSASGGGLDGLAATLSPATAAGIVCRGCLELVLLALRRELRRSNPETVKAASLAGKALSASRLWRSRRQGRRSPRLAVS